MIYNIFTECSHHQTSPIFVKKALLEHSHLPVLSMTVFLLHWQSRGVGRYNRSVLWPTESKIFTFLPSQKVFANPLFSVLDCFQI